MIVVQDRIELVATEVARLQQMFRERYAPSAEQRGLHFIESRVSPPLQLQDAPVTLWLRWQVADAGAWWGMRAQSATPDVAAFWKEVDSFCVSRERVYLGDDNVALPSPADTSAFTVQTRGHRETAQLALRDGLSAEERAEFEQALQAAQQLPGREIASLSANLAPEYAAGHYTWDLLFPDAQIAQAARDSKLWQETISPALQRYCSACHALGMETIGAGLRQAELHNGIKRTAYFRLLPGVNAERAKRFESDLLEMPAHIPEILNWRLSRALPLPWHRADAEPWTYVWEQEFKNLDGLTGPYMIHPHHWAHIDRWFDPESGAQGVDVKLSHAFSPLAESLMAREVF